MKIEEILIFMIIALKGIFGQSCYYKYYDRKLPDWAIAHYEKHVKPYSDTGCPLVKEDGDFTISEVPLKYLDYTFRKSLYDGACISYGYQKGEVPFSGGWVGNNDTRKELVKSRGGAIYDDDDFFLPYATIYTTITNKQVREISDEKRSVTLDVALTLMWMDYEIFTYESSTEELLKGKTINELTPEKARLIWKPHLPIYDLYNYNAFSASFRMVSLKILKNIHFDDGLCLAGPMLQYHVEAKVTVYCDLDFSNYPMDESNCKMLFGGQRSNLRFQLHDPNNTYHRNQSFSLSDLKVVVSVLEEPGLEHTKQKVGLRINIRRYLQPYVLKYYLPCIIITLVSQCSFLIPLEALPGRITLVVTQLLTLTSLFIHEMDKSPPSGSSIGKLSVFLLVSIFFIVATMIEFVIVLLSKRCFEKKISPTQRDTRSKHSLKIGSKRTSLYENDIKLVIRENVDADIHGNPHNDNLNNQLKRAFFNSLFQPNEKPKASGAQKLVEKKIVYKNHLDISSAILFPIAYAFFNIIYWYCVM